MPVKYIHYFPPVSIQQHFVENFTQISRLQNIHRKSESAYNYSAQILCGTFSVVIITEFTWLARRRCAARQQSLGLRLFLS
jgi:hypothetical protein